MRRTRSTRIATLTGAIALAVIAVAAPSANAQVEQRHSVTAAAAAKAGPGDICLWSGRDYTGASWCWNPGNGYVDVPPALHDNVGSFIADANGCFINWIHVPDRKETRVVRRGDYRRMYKDDFGGKIDAVAPFC